MKKSYLIEGILFSLGGMTLLLIVFLTDSLLDSLFVGFASGAICSGIVIVCKYFYWTMPANTAHYQEKAEFAKIEMQDERKASLRDRAARYSYVLGLITVGISIVIFSILGTLGFVVNSRIIILYLGLYLLFQIGTDILIYKRLLEKY